MYSKLNNTRSATRNIISTSTEMDGCGQPRCASTCCRNWHDRVNYGQIIFRDALIPHTHAQRPTHEKQDTSECAPFQSFSLSHSNFASLSLARCLFLCLVSTHKHMHTSHTHCSFPSVSKLQESCTLSLISGMLLIQLLRLFQIRQRSASSWLVGWSLCEGILIKPD